MEPGSPCPEGSSMHHAMGINARQTRSSTRERNHFALLFTLSAALGLCVAFLAPLVGAEDTLTFKVPGEVTLCTPVNFTWTGGIPPYRLDVEPTVNNVPNTTANQRRTAIQNTWVLWTPDFPAGSRLEINVVGSGFSPSAGGFSDVLSSSDSSCLAAASTTTSAAPSTSASSSSANGLVTSVDQPSATSSPIVLASSRGGLSKGAIAGIAVAATLIGIGLIALAAWYLYRRKHRLQQPEKGYDRSIVSPAFSDDAPTSTVPYSGLSSTLLSVDPNKLYAFTTPSTSVTGASSPDDRDPLRPTPYLVPPESTTDRSLSTSDVRKGPAPGNSNSKKHARELSDPTSTSNESAANLSASDDRVRATVTPTRSASPSQLACSADGDEAGSRSGSGDGDGDVLRFDADGAARLSLSLGSAIGGGGSLHLGFSDIGASDSGEGETTLPPPYAHYFGGGPRTEEA